MLILPHSVSKIAPNRPKMKAFDRAVENSLPPRCVSRGPGGPVLGCRRRRGPRGRRRSGSARWRDRGPHLAAPGPPPGRPWGRRRPGRGVAVSRPWARPRAATRGPTFKRTLVRRDGVASVPSASSKAISNGADAVLAAAAAAGVFDLKSGDSYRFLMLSRYSPGLSPWHGWQEWWFRSRR